MIVPKIPTKPLDVTRCMATNRNGTPCQRRKVPGRNRCHLHGGRSTGPRTPDGKARVAAAHFKHGRRRRILRVEAHERREVKTAAKFMGKTAAALDAFGEHKEAARIRGEMMELALALEEDGKPELAAYVRRMMATTLPRGMLGAARFALSVCLA